MATDWDAKVVLRAGQSNQTVTVRNAAGLRTVNVPGGMSPREFAATIHAYDGYIVLGFGYAPGEVHPEDCALCGLDTVNDPHWYIGEDN